MTSPSGGRYAFDHLRLAPGPAQDRIPLVIGGSGERKTLRIVAEHADNPERLRSAGRAVDKDEVLRRHCEDVGRQPGPH